MAVDAAELARLFAGDELSAPCPREALALELCRTLRPGSLAELRGRVYGDWPDDMVSVEERRCLQVGYARWVSERFVGKVPA